MDANQAAGAAATGTESLQPDANDRRELPPAAQRALAEAAERRRLKELAHEPRPKEINGRDGPEPARYGDWEVKGIASDF
ncbi:DUF1674 domain-containing protein [Methylocella silvestris]|uniref:DUF1674 domain-containing protein n=1 Tax=Methylocella silvestris TaxID=199596 RepID=UPI003CC75328